jgi:hypothetical protein
MTDRGWRAYPIPLTMTLRGVLPRWLGGEMVYEAVVRLRHFPSQPLLIDYLMEQAVVAIHREEWRHLTAIRLHLHDLITWRCSR